MSRFAHRGIPTIFVMTLVMCFFVFGGAVFHPHVAHGAAGNGRIAFAGDDTNSNLQIYTMNPDGSDVQQLTSNAKDHYIPAWSHDGSKIGYVSTDFSDDSTQVFVMDADGSNQTDITNDDSTQNSAFAWSPDGTKIAYTTQPSDNSTQDTIDVMNANGTNKVTLTNGATESNTPAWSPDGTKIAYICVDGSFVSQVCTMNADGSNKQQITSGSSVDYMDIAYSPDGAEFAYTTISHGGGYIQHLGTMNVDGSNKQTITTQNTDVYYASWSPDGTTLLFDNFDASQSILRIYTIHPDGSDETAVSPDNQYSITSSWQPAPAGDVDNDGISDTTEAAAPNGGDANNDGISDKYQPNVTSFVDPVNGKYVAVQSSCTSNTAVSAEALPINYGDSAFSYLAGLLGFTLVCGTHGTTATVTQYFYGISAQNTMVLRKYNSSSHTYTTVPGATITGTTIGGQTVTKVVYQITDGGVFDQDGSANGTIVDPTGLAVPSVGTPNTGVDGAVSFPRRLAAPLL